MMEKSLFEEMNQMPDPYPEQAGANKKSPECENPAEQARISQDSAQNPCGVLHFTSNSEDGVLGFSKKLSLGRPYRIALCGQSIFLHTIEAALAQDPAVEVLRLLSHLPSTVERITAWQPDIVLIERSAKHSELALALLDQGLPLVEMEVAANRGTFLIGQDVPLANLDDLTQLIEKHKLTW
ncbi:MAG: hypothetical protein V3S14_04460 [Anaerolineae bacterium]